MSTILNGFAEEYRGLLDGLDSWFGLFVQNFSEEITCHDGCSGCCRGIFDITILDACLLRTGFETLLSTDQQQVLAKKAQVLLGRLQSQMPHLASPWFIHRFDKKDQEALFLLESETPCIFLEETGKCVLYNYRPMTCRLHGVPMVDAIGVLHDNQVCTLNFSKGLPEQLTLPKANFNEVFLKEQQLIQALTKHLFGISLSECDTLIPAAACVDLNTFLISR